MPKIDDKLPLPYVRKLDGKTETMIPIGPHDAVNETSAKTLGLLAKKSTARNREAVL